MVWQPSNGCWNMRSSAAGTTDTYAMILWPLACWRCRYCGSSGKPWRYHREQARSHNVAASPVGAGLPAMQVLWFVRQTVAMPSRASPLPQCRRKSSGSWLACDAGTEGCQANRDDTIASKPAPTMSPQVQWELACLRCRYWGLSGKPWRCHREQARSHRGVTGLAASTSPLPLHPWS